MQSEDQLPAVGEDIIEAKGFVFEEVKEQQDREEEGIDVYIKGLDGKQMFYRNAQGEVAPVLINVVGSHSPTARRIDAQVRQRKLKPNQLKGETFYNDSVEKAAGCTRHWQGFIFNGKETRCDPFNAKQIYHTFPHVLEQVTDAMEDHSSFFDRTSPK